jgi:hypothetical protein
LAVQLADPVTRRRVAHDDEHPWLGVLGAGRVRRGLEHLFDDLVRNRFRGERTMCSLRSDD